MFERVYSFNQFRDVHFLIDLVYLNERKGMDKEAWMEVHGDEAERNIRRNSGLVSIYSF